jgi:type II secretion system protein N
MTLAQEVRDTQGEIDLTVVDLKLGDGRAKLALPGMGDGLTIEQVQMGDLEFRVRAENGVAQVERLHAHGEDAEFDGSGSLQLLRPMRRSRLDLLVRLNFLDAYKEKSDRTRALFSLLELNPRVQPARTSDGALQYRIAGALGSNLDATAAGRSPAPSTRQTPRDAATGDDAP